MPRSVDRRRVVAAEPVQRDHHRERLGSAPGVDHRPAGLGAAGGAARRTTRSRHGPERRRGRRPPSRRGRAQPDDAAGTGRAATPPRRRRRRPRRRPPHRAEPSSTARRVRGTGEGRGLWRAHAGSAPEGSQWWDADSDAVVAVGAGDRGRGRRDRARSRRTTVERPAAASRRGRPLTDDQGRRRAPCLGPTPGGGLGPTTTAAALRALYVGGLADRATRRRDARGLPPRGLRVTHDAAPGAGRATYARAGRGR